MNSLKHALVLEHGGGYIAWDWIGIRYGISMGVGMVLTQEKFSLLRVKTQNREIPKNRVLIRKYYDEIDVLPKP